MDQPRWLEKPDIVSLHQYVIDRTGGAPGIRDEGLLESALARAFKRWSYEVVDDPRTLAATYAVAVAKNHPFVDGNKRTAFLCLGLFLELNGWTLIASDDTATSIMLQVAASAIDEDTLAAWVIANCIAR